jgi:hypothetical protein
MPRWQYRRIDLNDLPTGTDDIMILKEAGAEGWELVAIISNRIAYLKRQLPDPAPALASVGRTRRKTEPSAE